MFSIPEFRFSIGSDLLLYVLCIQGIGYSVAAWQPCFLVLSGLYLYVLDSETSQNYQRCSRSASFLSLFTLFCSTVCLVRDSAQLLVKQTLFLDSSPSYLFYDSHG